jgi:hypothetical protein
MLLIELQDFKGAPVLLLICRFVRVHHHTGKLEIQRQSHKVLALSHE